MATFDIGKKDVSVEIVRKDVTFEGYKGPPGADGTDGQKGDKGDPGAGIVMKGNDTYENILLKSGDTGDMWLVSVDHLPEANAGDGMVSDGGGMGAAHWTNVGPIQGPQGAHGPPGGATLTASWKYSDKTFAPPSSGEIRGNASTPITTIWIHSDDEDGVTRVVEIESLIAGESSIYLRDDVGKYAHYIINSIGDMGEYYTLAVTFLEGNPDSVKKGIPILVDFVTPPAPGEKGDTGEKGDPGNDGADSTVPGPKGDPGDDGADSTIPGPKGDKGDTGFPGADSTIPGPKGDPGNDGADSTVPGPKGDTGTTGAKGDKGDDGTDGTGVTIAGSDTIANILAMTPATAGVMWLADSDDAGAAIPGVAGDGYVWDGSVWTNVGPIRGPKGDRGTDGNDGADSTVPGPKGDKGDTGFPGADSTVPGPKGDPGNDGADGADSTVPGPKGDPGDDGADSTVPGPQGDPTTVVGTADEIDIDATDPANLIVSISPNFTGGGGGGAAPFITTFDNSDLDASFYLTKTHPLGYVPASVTIYDINGYRRSVVVNASSTEIRLECGGVIADTPWTLVAIGPYGEKGDVGIQGLQGDQGDQGDTGADGADSTVPGPKGDPTTIVGTTDEIDVDATDPANPIVSISPNFPSGGDGGGLAWETSDAGLVTGIDGAGYLLDCSAGPRIIDLPHGIIGEQIGVGDWKGNAETNAITIKQDPANKIMGLAENLILNKDHQSVILSYADATRGWQIVGGAW